MTVRIAGWSGPRNISTAMMRAWESRPDCSVIDEPFYACYLKESGADHPMREQILASQSTSREAVAKHLSASAMTGLQYEKHMTHHMPRGIDLLWTKDIKHVFLIRSPERVIASYREKMPSVSPDDIGIIRQRELFDEITALTGQRPPVVDSADVLAHPKAMMREICEALCVEWVDGCMTDWKQGARPSDGVWAAHWYGSVKASSGFSAASVTPAKLSAQDLALAEEMRPHYAAMATCKLPRP